MSEPTCKRCAKCCFLVDGMGNPTKKLCKFCISMGNNRFACRIYKTRLGTLIGKADDGFMNVCVMREKSKLRYEGCEYNE